MAPPEKFKKNHILIPTRRNQAPMVWEQCVKVSGGSRNACGSYSARQAAAGGLRRWNSLSVQFLVHTQFAHYNSGNSVVLVAHMHSE